MTEQQADTDNTQPTPGPWGRQYPEELDPLVHAESGEFLVMCKATDIPLKEAVANARLIAAAGTAASELPEGYDPVAAVLEELPRLLDALQTIARADGTRYAGTDALQHVAENALDAIRTQSEIND
jgi:hypothetical protein